MEPAGRSVDLSRRGDGIRRIGCFGGNVPERDWKWTFNFTAEFAENAEVFLDSLLGDLCVLSARFRIVG